MASSVAIACPAQSSFKAANLVSLMRNVVQSVAVCRSSPADTVALVMQAVVPKKGIDTRSKLICYSPDDEEARMYSAAQRSEADIGWFWDR